MTMKQTLTHQYKLRSVTDNHRMNWNVPIQMMPRLQLTYILLIMHNVDITALYCYVVHTRNT